MKEPECCERYRTAVAIRAWALFEPARLAAFEEVEEFCSRSAEEASNSIGPNATPALLLQVKDAIARVAHRTRAAILATLERCAILGKSTR